MRRSSLTLLSVVLAGLAAVQIASAADLPRRAPAYMPPAPPPFTWTGFYGGIHAGWGWSDTSATVVDNLILFDPVSLGQNGNGVIGGAQIGYNWQFTPNFVVGIEGDISGTGIRDTTIAPITVGGVVFAPGLVHTAERDIKWLATLRGRLGFAVDRWLIYVTGGGAWGAADYTAGPTFVGVYNPVTFSHTSSGWTVGGGVEYGFANNWTGRLEYLHYDLAGTSVTNPSVVPGFAATQVWDRNQINVVRAAVNYKF